MSSEAQKLELQLRRLVAESAPLTKILNTSERLLSSDPHNLLGLQSKSLCCLLKDKVGAALSLLERIEQNHPREASNSPLFAFRKAYCFYRLRQYEEAQQVLTRAGELVNKHLPCRHLQAQVHYNLEKYEEASKMYLSILTDGAYRDEQEKAEIVTNLSAAYSACNPLKSVETIRQSDQKTYDMCFNAAIALVEAGDLSSSMKMLTQAETLCAADYPLSSLHTLKEFIALGQKDEALLVQKMGITAVHNVDRVFFNEVVNIWVQMAYVWELMGERERASYVLHLVLLLKPNSVATNALAATNWTGIQVGHRDFFEVSRRLKLCLNPATLDRLTSKQLLSLRYNNALLQLQSGSMANCRRELEHLRREFPEHHLTHSLSLAVLSVEASKKNKPLSVKEVETLTMRVEAAAKESTSTSHPLSANAIAAEVFLKQGDLQNATKYLMNDISAKKSTLSVVATIAAWRVDMGDTAGAIDYLQKEIRSMTPAQATKMLHWGVQYIGIIRGLYEEVNTMVQHLWETAPELRASKAIGALRSLVLSYVDSDEAVKASSSIQNVNRSSSNTDFALLKELTVSQPSRQQMEQLGFRRPTTEDKDTRATRVRRKRKMRRPPKSMEGKIDPERWVPMNLRSYIVNLPDRRKRELRRLRAIEQDRLRRIFERRKAESKTEAAVQ